MLIHQHPGEMAEPAEGARLLSECGGKLATEGSNPSLSAISIQLGLLLTREAFLFGGLIYPNRYKNRYNALRKSVFGDCFNGCGLRRELLPVSPRNCEPK